MTQLRTRTQRTQPSRRPLRRVLAGALALAAATTGGLVYAGSSRAPGAGAVTAPSCGAGQVGGVAFRDYNADGIKSATEPGIAGIDVTVTDSSGAVVGTATTAVDGSWVVDGVSGDVRVEYTSTIDSGPHGTDSLTTVSFGSSGDCGLSAGFNDPGDYCQANPTLVTNCYVAGSLQDPNRPDKATLVSFPADSSSVPGENTTGTTLATADQVGTTYGIAYNRCDDVIYTSAFTKRHADYGPGGPGAIYAVAPDGSSSTIFTTVSNVGTDTHPTFAGDSFEWLRDPATFDAVGKMGLGDLEMSPDCSTLYSVNMFTRSLVVIDVNDPTSQTSITIPVPAGCADPRPMGLGWHDGKLYVGGVCSESTSGAHIYVYVFDPATNTFSATPALDTISTRPSTEWGDWATSWSDFWTWTPPVGQTGTSVGYAQPMLSDIVFDGDQMIIGLRDRTGDQTAYMAPSTIPGDNNLYLGYSFGDVVTACTADNITWTLESAGQCGGVTGFSTNNNEGPGGGEFYSDQASQETGDAHVDSTNGGLVFLQDMGLLNTAIDPNDWWSGGVLTYGSPAQRSTNEFELYQSDASVVTLGYIFGKANGLGDLEALCNAAPIEIGNRVWDDLDADGIQDAGELGIAAVTVELLDSANNVVGTTTTDASGNYYFNVDPSTAYTIRFTNTPSGHANHWHSR